MPAQLQIDDRIAGAMRLQHLGHLVGTGGADDRIAASFERPAQCTGKGRVVLDDRYVPELQALRLVGA